MKKGRPTLEHPRHHKISVSFSDVEIKILRKIFPGYGEPSREIYNLAKKTWFENNKVANIPKLDGWAVETFKNGVEMATLPHSKMLEILDFLESCKTVVDNQKTYINDKIMNIQEVQIGQIVNSPKNGKGMITAKTKRTVTVTFENGNVVKNTYSHNNAYFWSSDF